MTQPSVLFLVPQSHECWFFFLSFWHHFFKCAFTCAVHIWQSEDTCWYTLMRKELGGAFCKLPINVHLGGSHRIPNPRRLTMSSPVLPQCVTGLLFSASLLPCSAFRSDSSWPIQAAYHSIHWLADWRQDVSLLVGGEDLGGTKLLMSRWAPALWCISTAVVQY